MTENTLQILQEQLPVSAMIMLLEPDPILSVAIKSHQDGYLYANKNFLMLMGICEAKKLLHKKDADLCHDLKLLKIYREHDEQVYDTDKPIQVSSEIKPSRHDKLIKEMEGMTYPLHLKGKHPDAVIFIHRPKNNIITLSFEHLCLMTPHVLRSLLTKKSYRIKTLSHEFNLAKMEIVCFSEMIKGKPAGRIAEVLGLKQMTVESYLCNLRNKCGVNKKQDLIQFFIEHKILEKIIV